jgi:hypothetical protein
LLELTVYPALFGIWKARGVREKSRDGFVGAPTEEKI